MSSLSPGYSPAERTPSTVGADAASGTVVAGTTAIVIVSAPVPALGWSEPGAILMLASGAVGRLVSVLVTSNETVVSAPAASGPYDCVTCAAVKLDGNVSLTSPLWVTVDQLWTATLIVFVSPTPIDCSACERPRRRASGAVFSAQSSYSA